MNCLCDFRFSIDLVQMICMDKVVAERVFFKKQKGPVMGVSIV
jgi:hypothetical protein